MSKHRSDHPYKSSQKRDRKSRNKGIVSFGVSALVLSILFKPFRVFDLALVGAFAFLVGKLVAALSGGLDLTTHNKQDKVHKELENLSTATGDENADAVIAKGQEMLRQIRAENDAIPDPTLSDQMYELERLCVQIFKTVAEKPGKAPQIRKFMNYYLPTTLKMLGSYRTMQNRGVSRKDLDEARSTLIRGMNMVLTACQKQLDNLFKDDMLDVSTDIDVLEQMLKRDGFVDGGLGNIPKEPVEQPAAQARTAAAAQMGASSRPILKVEETKTEEDFPSFYQQRK